MRILVLSDSHGARRKVEDVLLRQSKAEVVLHLGDGADDLEYARVEYPAMAFYQVEGNCDRCCDFPDVEQLTIEGQRIFFTHGHLFGVKRGIDALLEHGRSKGADIVLFGHTHRPETGYEDGLYWMNPGSLREGSYGFIDITDKGIVTNLVKL